MAAATRPRRSRASEAEFQETDKQTNRWASPLREAPYGVGLIAELSQNWVHYFPHTADRTWRLL